MSPQQTWCQCESNTMQTVTLLRLGVDSGQGSINAYKTHHPTHKLNPPHHKFDAHLFSSGNEYESFTASNKQACFCALEQLESFTASNKQPCFCVLEQSESFAASNKQPCFCVLEQSESFAASNKQACFGVLEQSFTASNRHFSVY